MGGYPLVSDLLREPVDSVLDIFQEAAIESGKLLGDLGHELPHRDGVLLVTRQRILLGYDLLSQVLHQLVQIRLLDLLSHSNGAAQLPNHELELRPVDLHRLVEAVETEEHYRMVSMRWDKATNGIE